MLNENWHVHGRFDLFFFHILGFSRLLTYAYSSSFVLALTELVVSALSGRLYAQSQQLIGQNQTNTTAPGAVSATTKSSHAEVNWKSTKTKF